MFRINFKKSLLLLIFAIPNTLLNIGLLYIINSFLTGNIHKDSNYLIFVFFYFLIYSYLINSLYQGRLIKHIFSSIYDNEIKILKILHDTPLPDLEKYGSNRFYNTLEDLRIFIFLPSLLINALNSVLTIIICLSYLFWISPGATAILSILIFLIVGSFIFLNKRWYKKHKVVRELNDEYYNYIDDSLKGFKELKISQTRTDNFFNRFFIPNRHLARQADIQLTSRYMVINLLSQYGIYILLGCVLYFLDYFQILDQKETITYAVALLFINGPINSLVSMQNMYVKVWLANKRIKSFFELFGTTTTVTNEPAIKKVDFECLSFRNVSFKYHFQENNRFALKEVKLKIEKGEVIFIVGGNGSGKSTFVNILTGLYQPTQGDVLLNNSITNNSNPSYKDLFSVIYTDNHLFYRNYDDYNITGNMLYQQLLKKMEMDKVITDDSDNGVRRKFSKGQSKRMSMIFALMENKPILVLDEWAADQDPHFRKYFYENLIPQLRKEGKTIIAVTHDDAYFKYADRIIKFDYGNIVKEINAKEDELFTIL